MLPVANGEGVRPGAAAGQQVANLCEKFLDYFFLLAELGKKVQDFFGRIHEWSMSPEDALKIDDNLDNNRQQQ